MLLAFELTPLYSGLILLLLTNFFILGTANLRSAIRGVALQGLLLGVLPFFVESQATVRLVLLVIGAGRKLRRRGRDGRDHGENECGGTVAQCLQHVLLPSNTPTRRKECAELTLKCPCVLWIFRRAHGQGYS